jgi:hypothetical protein
VKNGPLTHLLSGRFATNSALLVLAAIAFNLTRAGALASTSSGSRQNCTTKHQVPDTPLIADATWPR